MAWLLERGNQPGPLWLGQRGPLSVSGVTQVVLAVGHQAGIAGLRPHRLRHTYATRLRQGGTDPAQVQALLGHASVESCSRRAPERCQWMASSDGGGTGFATRPTLADDLSTPTPRPR